MSDILIVVATESESVAIDGPFEHLVTGPGMVATTYHLTRQLQTKKYRLAINLGICGSLDETIIPGNLVQITTDQFADFGAEDGENFIPATQLGLMKANQYPFINGKLTPPTLQSVFSDIGIPKREGITVQKVHGSDKSAAIAFERFGPVMESMEGAAFFYCCMMENVPCLQFRAVSNRVEKRQKELWKISEAIEHLQDFALQLSGEIKKTVIL